MKICIGVGFYLEWKDLIILEPNMKQDFFFFNFLTSWTRKTKFVILLLTLNTSHHDRALEKLKINLSISSKASMTNPSKPSLSIRTLTSTRDQMKPFASFWKTWISHSQRQSTYLVNALDRHPFFRFEYSLNVNTLLNITWQYLNITTLYYRKFFNWVDVWLTRQINIP